MDRTAAYPIENRTILEALFAGLRAGLAARLGPPAMAGLGRRLYYDIGESDLRPSPESFAMSVSSKVEATGQPERPTWF